VSDLRLMVCGSDKGFRVVGIYGRKSRRPLTDTLEPGYDTRMTWCRIQTTLGNSQSCHRSEILIAGYGRSPLMRHTK
jgi:hypothetical protein